METDGVQERPGERSWRDFRAIVSRRVAVERSRHAQEKFGRDCRCGAREAEMVSDGTAATNSLCRFDNEQQAFLSASGGMA